jgi:serine/threonine protein kinase
MEIGQFLRVAISFAAAVRQLHGRGLIHKDLKPANVMVEPRTRPGLADRLWNRLAIDARALVGGASLIHRGNPRLHGSCTNLKNESFNRFAE